MEKIKVQWWRYVVAVVLFVVMYFLLPGVAALVSWLSNLIAPPYLRNTSPLWSEVFGHITSAAVSAYAVEVITKRSMKFTGVLCIIAAVYTLLVSAGNFAAGFNEIEITIAMVCEGVTYIVEAIMAFSKEQKVKSVENESTK